MLVATISCNSLAQQLPNFSSSSPAIPAQQVNSPVYSEWSPDPGLTEPMSTSPYTPVVPWQEQAAAGGASGGSDGAGGGAGAAEANNPGVPFSQFQFKNVFIPESNGSHGYANQFIVQPVIAIKLNPDHYFQYHIVRATLPVLAAVLQTHRSGRLTIIEIG